MSNEKVLMILSVLILTGCEAGHFKGREETICVTSKEIILKGMGETLRRNKVVFTKDNVYNVEDSLLAFDWESLTRFAKLQQGKCYEVETNWSRFGFLSWKRNIVEIKQETINNERS